MLPWEQGGWDWRGKAGEWAGWVLWPWTAGERPHRTTNALHLTVQENGNHSLTPMEEVDFFFFLEVGICILSPYSSWKHLVLLTKVVWFTPGADYMGLWTLSMVFNRFLHTITCVRSHCLPPMWLHLAELVICSHLSLTSQGPSSSVAIASTLCSFLCVWLL